jgi:FkbM family methyltransferase
MRIQRFVRRHPLLRRVLAAPRSWRRAWLAKQEAEIADVIARLANILAEDVVLHIEEFNGYFACGPHSDLFKRIARLGYYEPNLASVFLGHVSPDRDVLDIGANVGFYSVGAARRLDSGRVLAAEPTSAASERLAANLCRNGVADKVIIYKGLVGAEAGEATINSVIGREEYSSRAAIQHPSAIEASVRIERVPSARIDDLVVLHELHPAVMKVDVEGSEGEVFAGSSHVLTTHRPIVLSEIANPLLQKNGTCGREIVQMFERLDYRVVDANDERAKPGEADFSDILCTPRELVNQWRS